MKKSKKCKNCTTGVGKSCYYEVMFMVIAIITILPVVVIMLQPLDYNSGLLGMVEIMNGWQIKVSMLWMVLGLVAMWLYK